MSAYPEIPRILVVDDEQIVRHLLGYVLGSVGYQVDTANDGAEGLLALQTKHYDLLITDHTMPGLSGLELIKRLRSERMTLPVIMLSGALNPDKLLDLDFLQTLFLSKPFSITDLLAKVKTALPRNLLPGLQILPSVVPDSAPRNPQSFGTRNSIGASGDPEADRFNRPHLRLPRSLNQGQDLPRDPS